MEIKTDIIPSMILAPSAHNTQPWKFKTGNNSLDVFVDWNRHLEVSDPTERELYISLGCTIMNATVAAAKHGYITNIKYFPEGEQQNTPAAHLTFEKDGPNQHLVSLYDAIKDRRTDRAFFDQRPLTSKEKEKLKSVYDANTTLVEDKEKIEKLAEVTKQATYKTLGRKDFKEELSHWVRNSWTKQPDGMPGYAMGMPAPLSLLAAFMVKIAPIHKQEGPKIAKQMNSASAVAIITTEEDSKQAWMKAGQLLEQIWLEATAADLAAMPQVAAVESSPNHRNQINQILNTKKHPQTIIRLGHTSQKNLKPTPRRTVEDVTTQPWQKTSRNS